jgi:superfamily I DNA and/or RNA helicase
MDRTASRFDTVIIDDANLVNETDCLAALRHGCERAILIGNSDFD